MNTQRRCGHAQHRRSSGGLPPSGLFWSVLALALICMVVVVVCTAPSNLQDWPTGMDLP